MYVIRVTEILIECIYPFWVFRIRINDFPKLIVFRFTQAFDMFDGCVIQV